mmetsp:Transcript_62801/g.146200  ORF Transcript_62801/g.146200 Transcript_62801/m.146200 type:complete len:269 (+) Transcript_62801:1200-2006(+)
MATLLPQRTRPCRRGCLSERWVSSAHHVEAMHGSEGSPSTVRSRSPRFVVFVLLLPPESVIIKAVETGVICTVHGVVDLPHELFNHLPHSLLLGKLSDTPELLLDLVKCLQHLQLLLLESAVLLFELGNLFLPLSEFGTDLVVFPRLLAQSLEFFQQLRRHHGLHHLFYARDLLRLWRRLRLLRLRLRLRLCGRWRWRWWGRWCSHRHHNRVFLLLWLRWPLERRRQLLSCLQKLSLQLQQSALRIDGAPPCSFKLSSELLQLSPICS